MSGNQKSEHTNKYYNNDIKKLMGIDDSRSASEKLLDKVVNLKRDKFIDNNNQGLLGQIKKKLKKNQQNSEANIKPSVQLSSLQILQKKLIKNIKSQTNQVKLLKALSVLQKCLNQQHFLQDKQIGFVDKWRNYTEILIGQISQRNYYSGESFSIMKSLADCIQILREKFSNKIFIVKQTIQQNHDGQQKIKQKCQQKNKKIFDKEKTYIDFCRLFTDDCFVFNKHLNQIKNYLFSKIDKANHYQINNEKDNLIILEQQNSQNFSKFIILIKMVNMPIKYDWAYTSLSNLFKQFNNNSFHNQFLQNQRKQYLKKYNLFLNKKNISTATNESYNIMGQGKNIQQGAKVVHVQINNSSTDKWCSKQ